MKNAILGVAILYFGLPCFLLAQTPQLAPLHGLVTNEKEELLVGASVYWKDTHTGTFTDTSGYFNLPARKEGGTLVVQYFNYPVSEVQVLPGENNLWIEITGSSQLKEVQVSEQQFGNSVSTLETRNLESISQKELRKAPCCNLSESFETNGAIDVSYPNAVTGIREIQMLGLRGIYSQFLVENRPAMGGIATPFAFDFIPGTWLKGIILAKGASTVKNGNTGITGQINIDLVKPASDLPVFVNAFTSTEGRGEINVHLNKIHNINLSQGLLLHGNFVKNRWDMNHDNFYDAPNRQQINALYRVIYDGPKGCAQFNVQALSDHRVSGQIDDSHSHNGFFGVDQRNERVEAWAKYGKEGLFGKPYNELGNIASVSWHRTNSFFGPNVYTATQQSLYLQTLYQTIIQNTQHKVVLAPSLQYDHITEKVNDGDLGRKETIAGAMAEYTYSHPTVRMEGPDLVLVAGARMDHNSRFGWQFTPRVSAKYNFTEKTVVRISGGLGYRSPNLMAENLSVLASNRVLQFAKDLSYEKAWNYGINFTQTFKIGDKNASFSIDGYRTDFLRQIIVDVDQSPTSVLFYNLSGPSYSNSILAVAQYNLFKGFEIKLSYKINDVKTTYANGVVRTPPLLAKYRGLVTLDYTTPNKKWMFNLRTHIVGPQRLPDNSAIPHEYTHGFEQTTPVYTIWSGQITHHWKNMEVYVGMENISSYQQHHAIIAANEPNSPYFNGSQIWAPMMGRVANLGVRYAPGGLR